jgi:hypothetical protein
MKLFNRWILSHWAFLALRCSAFAVVAVCACTSSDATNATDGGSDSASRGTTSDANAEAASTCASPGEATPGPVDTHCVLPDGGTLTQPTSTESCHSDVGIPSDDGGGDQGCEYGETMFGYESDDDDCKYHVKWSSTAICEGSPGVVFTVVVTNKTDGTPLTSAQPYAEVFTTTPGDWDAAAFCDTMSTHPTPSGTVTLAENPPGTYTGTILFDQPGQWTVRFHFHPECSDVLPDSQHGHAAYHITVP